jgi:nucleoside-diphosphate-sugar epimerase
MKVFVAGGSGVLGRATVPALLEAGHQVRATARGEQKSAVVRNLGAQAVDIDLFDLAEVRHAVSGADAVLRLTTKFGAMSKLRDSRTWAETMRLRTTGARVLVDAALAEGVKTYVHESVSYVYADGGQNWLNEGSPTHDAGASILRATLQGEHEAERFTRSGGQGIVLRFGGFYGPDAPSTLESIAMARKRMLFQMGAATNYFSSIYIPDAGRAVAAAVTVPAGIYNVNDDEPVTFAEYLQFLADSIGAPKPRRLPGFFGRLAFGEIWKYFSRSLRVSNAKLKQKSGWEPKVKSAREGWPLIASEVGNQSGADIAA